jgi:hypothetical protein
MLPPHYVQLQPCASPTALAEFSNLAPVAPAAPGGSWACHFLLFVPRPNSALRPIAIASPGCRLLMRVHIWRLLGALLALVVESSVCTQPFPRRLAFGDASACANFPSQGASIASTLSPPIPSPWYHRGHPPTSPLPYAHAPPPPIPLQLSCPSYLLCAAGPPPQLNFVLRVLTISPSSLTPTTFPPRVQAHCTLKAVSWLDMP